MKVESEREVAQSCPTLRDPMDCSLPGSSVHGIFQARVLEWGAIAETWRNKATKHSVHSSPVRNSGSQHRPRPLPAQTRPTCERTRPPCAQATPAPRSEGGAFFGAEALGPPGVVAGLAGEGKWEKVPAAGEPSSVISPFLPPTCLRSRTLSTLSWG